MADTDTQAPAEISPDAIARLYQQLMAPPPALPTGTPDNGASPSWTGLLGRALSGGQAPGYQLRGGEADTSGNRALLNFGINTLLASGPHAVRPDLLSSVATGLQGAQESLGQDQSRAGALAAAQFQAQREGRQDQLARIEKAIPLLSLQAQQEAGRRALQLGTGSQPAAGTSTGSGGSIAPFVAKNLPEGVTPEEDQIVRTVIGEAAGQPLTGQQAVAHVIRNRMNAGGQGAQDVIFAAHQFEPWNNPKTRAGLEAIDPTSKQYQDVLTGVVRPVMGGQAKDPTSGATNFYSPTAQATLAKTDSRPLVPSWAAGQTPTAVIGAHNFYKLPYGGGGAASPPAPGQAGAPTPASLTPSAPGAKTQIPPPTVAAPGRAPAPGSIQVAPEPPLATTGTAQTAGPGAPTAGVIPASPPGSAADVADIQAGMANAQATPLVRAGQPGAVAVAAGPGASTPNPAFPDIKGVGGVTLSHPGAEEDYIAAHVDPNLPQARLDSYRDQMRAVAGLPNSADKIQGIMAAQNAEQIKHMETEVAAARAQYNKQQDMYFEAQKQANARQTAKEAADYTANQSEVTSRIGMRDDLRKSYNTQAQASGDAVQQLQIFRALSMASGEPGSLPQGAKDWLAARGLATPDQLKTWSAQSALNAANNHLIGIVRNGTGFSRTTNMDLDYLNKTMPGGADQSEAYRNAKAAFLITTFAHQQKYAEQISANLADGMSIQKAREDADAKVGSALKQEPTGLAPDDRVNWRYDNLENGQFYKAEDGSLGVFNPNNKPRPGAKPLPQE